MGNVYLGVRRCLVQAGQRRLTIFHNCMGILYDLKPLDARTLVGPGIIAAGDRES